MIRAVVFDCFGVLYIDTTHGYKLNEPLIRTIREALKPRYKLGLLSNTRKEWMDTFLDRYQLRDAFDTVVVSAEEGITKADPEIFRRTAANLSVSTAECLMIDDSIDNCGTAREAGMEALLYDNSFTFQQMIAYLQQESHA